MPRVFLGLVLLGSMAAVVARAPAWAQATPPPSTTDKTQVAKQYVDAGIAAEKLGDYDTAITFYQKAYQLVPHPVLLYNMAHAHRLAGRIDQAVALYKQYLAKDPGGPQAQVARDVLAEIEAKKAEDARKAEEARRAEEARKAAEAKQAEDARKAAEAKRAEDARKAEEARQAADANHAEPAKASAAPGATPPHDTGSETADTPRALRIAGIASGAAGAAGLIVSAGFGLHARSLSNELSQKGARYDPDKVSAGHRADTIMVIGLAGGTVLIAAGAAMYWWGYTHDRPAEQLSLAPMVSGGVAGLVVSGTLP